MPQSSPTAFLDRILAIAAWSGGRATSVPTGVAALNVIPPPGHFLRVYYSYEKEIKTLYVDVMRRHLLKQNFPDAPSAPAEILAVLGAPPVVAGEDPAEYRRLLGALGAGAGAVDALDWVVVDHACATIWSLRRLRHARDRLLEQEKDEKVQAMAKKLRETDVIAALKAALAENPSSEDTKEMREFLEEYNDPNYMRASKEANIGYFAKEFGIKLERDRVDVKLATAIAVEWASTKLAPLEDLIERGEARLDKLLQGIDRRRLHVARLEALANAAVTGAMPALKQLSKSTG